MNRGLAIGRFDMYGDVKLVSVMKIESLKM